MNSRTLIVVPTLDEEVNLERIVHELQSDSFVSTSGLIVIVDGGSTDQTLSIAKKLVSAYENVSLMHNAKRIQSAAVNLAVRAFGNNHDILIRCDAHSFYPDHFVSRLIASLDRTSADAVVVPMDTLGTAGIQRAIGWVVDTMIGSGGSAHRGGKTSGFVDHGHHAAFRMESFLRAGGYDETFSHNEDAEFDCRQRTHQARIYLDCDIRIGYEPRRTLRALWHQYKSYGKGRARTVLRHPSSLRLRQFVVPANLILLVVTLLLSCLSPYFLAWPMIYACLLMLVSVWFVWSKKSIIGLLTGPIALTMHTAWALGFLSALFQRTKDDFKRKDIGVSPRRRLTQGSRPNPSTEI